MPPARGSPPREGPAMPVVQGSSGGWHLRSPALEKARKPRERSTSGAAQSSHRARPIVSLRQAAPAAKGERRGNHQAGAEQRQAHRSASPALSRPHARNRDAERKDNRNEKPRRRRVAGPPHAVRARGYRIWRNQQQQLASEAWVLPECHPQAGDPQQINGCVRDQAE